MPRFCFPLRISTLFWCTSYWQHKGDTSSEGEGNSLMASLEDLVQPLWKMKAFFTVKKETVLSHTSELLIPVLRWLSNVERSLTALSVHFLSKIIILHRLWKEMEKHQINGRCREMGCFQEKIPAYLNIDGTCRNGFGNIHST